MEVLPGVHLVPSVRWSRAYLIVGDTLTLVDSGLPWHPRGVLKYIRSIGRRPEELDRILITHGHPDHVGGAAKLVRATRAKIIGHRADSHPSARNDLDLDYTGIGGRRSPLAFLSAAKLDVPVADGDILPDHGGIQVIHTPGHTRGSVCFLLESTRTLFSGDTLFSDGRRLSRSAPFPGYDRAGYVRSLKRLSEIEFDAVCGGHGAPLPGGGRRALSELLRARPDPPTWRDFFRSIPHRLKHHRPLTGEHTESG